jgi:hypothetical protein
MTQITKTFWRTDGAVFYHGAFVQAAKYIFVRDLWRIDGKLRADHHVQCVDKAGFVIACLRVPANRLQAAAAAFPA